MAKIKVFLGGFINVTNSQNLICKGLAENLDKSKFEIYTLEVYSGNLPSQTNTKNLNIFNCFKPFGISIYLGFLWGIYKCDVAFISKGEIWRFNKFVLKLLNKKSFNTIDGIYDEDNLKSAISILGNIENVFKSKSYVNKSYAITKFLGKYNFEQHKIIVEPKVLYLGCDLEIFKNRDKNFKNLKRIVYVGRLKQRKGIYDYLEIAKSFPDLIFYVFGNGEEKENIEKYLSANNINNIFIMGTANHIELSKFLKDVDLHILPSRSEGFGLVTLETAASSVPSILYGDYGVEEWVTHGKNGWIVNEVKEIKELINYLIKNPSVLKNVGTEARILAENFDWKIRILDWEFEIEKLFNEKQ